MTGTRRNETDREKLRKESARWDIGRFALCLVFCIIGAYIGFLLSGGEDPLLAIIGGFVGILIPPTVALFRPKDLKVSEFIGRLGLLLTFGAIGAGAGFLLGGGEDPWRVLFGAIVGALILPFLVAFFCLAKGGKG